MMALHRRNARLNFYFAGCDDGAAYPLLMQLHLALGGGEVNKKFSFDLHDFVGVSSAPDDVAALADTDKPLKLVEMVP